MYLNEACGPGRGIGVSSTKQVSCSHATLISTFRAFQIWISEVNRDASGQVESA